MKSVTFGAVCVAAAAALLLDAPGVAFAMAAAQTVGGTESVTVTVRNATAAEACDSILTAKSQGARSASTPIGPVKADGTISSRISSVASGTYNAKVACEVEGNLSNETVTVSPSGGGGTGKGNTDFSKALDDFFKLIFPG